MMKKIISSVLALTMAATLAVGANATRVGDVNTDGNVDTTDALQVLQYAVGDNKTINPRLGDMNADGRTDSTDALYILQVTIGAVTNNTDVKTTNYKSTKIDPVLKSKKFTLKTQLTQDGTTYPATIMIDGKNLVAEMSAEGITARMLILDGKSYCVFPAFFCYAEVPVGDIEIGDFGAAENLKYVYTVNATIGGKTYEKEMYLSENGKVQYNYYFLNGEWKYFETVSGGKSDMQSILDFKAGINESWFKLSGVPIDIGDLI